MAMQKLKVAKIEKAIPRCDGPLRGLAAKVKMPEQTVKYYVWDYRFPQLKESMGRRRALCQSRAKKESNAHVMDCLLYTSLGKDRLALYSFIHSLNTNFGTSFFEPVAKALAQQNFTSAETQQSAGTQITSEAYLVIHEIMSNLTTATCSPNKIEEIEKIRAVCRKGTPGKVKLTNVDVKVVSKDGTVYLFDIKTAKPNKGGFKEFKRTLLEWIAAYLLSLIHI